MTVSAFAYYAFNDPSLLKEALSHPSLDQGYSYQRLEFLGDRVLGLVISSALLERYPDDPEGSLNARLSALVRRETVAEVAQTLKLDRMILLSEGAEGEGTRGKPSVLCDIGEAIIGAIYLDGGLQAATDFILTHWEPYLSGGASALKDAKTRLQEWAQARGLPLPSYDLVNREGPDHAPVFWIAVSVQKGGTAKAQASSKRAGEQAAAAALLKTLEA